MLKYIRPFLRVFVGRGGFHHPDGALLAAQRERITAEHANALRFAQRAFRMVERGDDDDAPFRLKHAARLYLRIVLNLK